MRSHIKQIVIIDSKMCHVILQIDLSLDGFAAGTNGETDWIQSDEEMIRDAEALLASVDTLLLGRVAYQMFAAFWPATDIGGTVGRIARHINTAEKIVFSKSLTAAPWGDWGNARLASGDAAWEIARLKAQPGARMLLYGGARIAASFIKLGLVDEYRLRIHPIALGAGMPVFVHTADRLNLSLVKTTQYQCGVVLLEYRST
jgi:dihydrofolate reductase